MKKSRKSIFNWNHISDKLTEEQIEELKSYYQTYHKKCFAYKQAVKHLKKWRLLGNSLSIIFASGGIASSIASGGISLIAISTTALLIQGWMKHKDLDLKIQNCTGPIKPISLLFISRISFIDIHFWKFLRCKYWYTKADFIITLFTLLCCCLVVLKWYLT